MINLLKMTTLGVDIKAKIYFYFHYDLYNHMFNSAKEGLIHLKGDSAYHLYAAISLILMNQLEEGIQHLEIILSENDVKLAAMIALKYSKNLMKAGNKDLVLDLGDQMMDFHKFSDSLSFYYTAFTFMAFKQFKKAFEYINKALAIHNDNSDYYALKGWILMKHQNNQITHEDIRAVFQKSLQLNSKNFNSTIGLTEYNLKQNNFMEALNVINKAVVQYTSTDLPLIQKLKIQFAMLDWEQAIETINRIFTINSRSLYARKMFITILLSYSVNYDGALKELNSFKTILNKEESKNVTFILESSKLFSRVCNKNTNILVETSKMLENALQNNVEDVDVIVEMGNQCLMKNQIKDALRFFKNALKIEESSFHALYGLLLCELSENGTTPQLQSQYDDLLKLRNDDNFIYLDFLQVKINKQFPSALEVLLNICIFKLNQLKIHYFSEPYLLILDPIFMVEVANEYISHLTSSKQGDHSSIHEILKLIVQCCPALEEAAFLLAKIQFIQGDINNALINLENLLKKTVNPSSEAYLLMAQIQIQNGFHERAAQNLEICVSQNFKIRENPTYHYILGVIEKNSKNYPDAINLFSSALNLIGMKSAEISLTEKSSIYVELIDTLNIVGQHEEAIKLLEDATNELKGTPVEARILLSSATQLLKRRNIQGAIDLLSNIKPSDSCYKEAKAMHADILLKHRKDKHAYIQCYKNLVDEMPGDESYILMGDAYMKILEPDYALECYENALKESPKNPVLIAKMGQALVDCHYFTRAIHYYKDAIKNPGDIKLKLKLAELYMNLKQYDKGELILLNELEEEKANNLEDLTYMQTKTEMMILLSEIRERSGNLHHALRILKDALDNQNRVKKRIELEKSGTLDSEINVLVKICLKLGHIATSLKNTEQAVNFYKEGLQTCPNNIELLVALANLYMQMNYLELCQQTCSTVLRIDPDNETASVMMADIAFRKIDFDMALFHFTQLVTKQPTNWEALIRLIEILYRTANLTDCPDYLKAAEEHSDDPKKETKLLYCIGLYQWYSGNLNSALRNFNLARQDSSLGRKALYNMIEICLNLDDELLADQVTELDDVDYKESRVMALKTAERLINELKKSEMSAEEILHHRLLSNFHLLSTRLKSNIEIALENFIAIASEIEGKENIGVIYGVAVAYTLLKQGQRAKNQLKRVAKSSWTFEDAKYLERCWLLLVDYYVQSAKYEIATDLINKVIHHNKGYVKSYEYLGFILEKEQRYKEAVKNYEQAWNYGGKNHPSVGFKLAYCLMKIKKYPEAINKAHEVLKINPGHPRIKKDILDKCMNNLRI